MYMYTYIGLRRRAGRRRGAGGHAGDQIITIIINKYYIYI